MVRAMQSKVVLCTAPILPRLPSAWKYYPHDYDPIWKSVEYCFMCCHFIIHIVLMLNHSTYTYTFTLPHNPISSYRIFTSRDKLVEILIDATYN